MKPFIKEMQNSYLTIVILDVLRLGGRNLEVLVNVEPKTLAAPGNQFSQKNIP